MPNYEIRAARPDDGPGLATLHLDMANYYVGLAPTDFHRPDATGLAEWMAPAEAEVDDRLYLVAENAGEIVGLS